MSLLLKIKKKGKALYNFTAKDLCDGKVLKGNKIPRNRDLKKRFVLVLSFIQMKPYELPKSKMVIISAKPSCALGHYNGNKIP